MDLKQALIVDDSKSAQHVLSRMLEKFDLRSDAAFSAEEALAYLSHHHPTVIFLDENMPGMNGIEALKTIKSNPTTALIPVIMYTSADDDVFVTQARALGALDILSKSNMQPESLARVLTSLKIFPVSENSDTNVAAADINTAYTATHNIAPPKPRTVDSEPTEDLTDLEKVSRQISRLFEIHITAVREQINNSAQLVTKRVLSNLEKNTSRNTAQGLQSIAPTSFSDLEAATIAANQALVSEKQKQSFISNALLSALLLGVLWVGYHLYSISSELELTAKNQLTVVDAKKQEAQQIANTVIQLMDDKANGKGAISHPAILKAMNWLQNTDFQYNFNEQPLNDTQVANLATFARLLSDGGFAGTLLVSVNFGNFCLENSQTNNVSVWRLAAIDVPVSDCKQLKDLNPKFVAADYITPAFRNFERSLAGQPEGRITVRLTSGGITQPKVDYPLITSTTTAGEWNNAAARNNRLSIQLSN